MGLKLSRGNSDSITIYDKQSMPCMVCDGVGPAFSLQNLTLLPTLMRHPSCTIQDSFKKEEVCSVQNQHHFYAFLAIILQSLSTLLIQTEASESLDFIYASRTLHTSTIMMVTIDYLDSTSLVSEPRRNDLRHQI